MDIPFSDPNQKRLATEGLLLTKQVFETLNVQYWLCAGTMLGAVREKDFIPHDSDIDIGVWGTTPNHERIKESLSRSGIRPKWNFGHEGTPGHQYAFALPGDVHMDLFFYAREGGRCWSPLWVGGQCKKCYFPMITDLVMVDFCGTTFPIPANYMDIILVEYGENWQTPIPPIERGGTWNWEDSMKNLER